MAVRPTQDYLAPLTIKIAPEAPLPASRIAKLLTALSKDYEAITGGRTLVLTDVQHGSVVLLFLDAVMTYGAKGIEAIEGVNALAEFSKRLKRAMDYFLLGKDAASSEPNRDASLKEIFNIAIASKAQVEIQHKAKDGTEIRIAVNPALAQAAKRSPKRKVRALQDQSRAVKSIGFDVRELEVMSPEKIAETLVNVSVLATRGNRAVVKDVIQVIREQFQLQPLKIKHVATALKGMHRYDLAEMLQSEPPQTLLTSN